MFEVCRTIARFAVPVFVIATMLNVGLTQKPSEIVRYLRKWHYVLRMLVANFVVVPLLMIVILSVTSLPPAYRTGLLIFSLGAGAPFLIKLTQLAKHHLALGAAIMMLLVLATIVYMPLVLPLVVNGASGDAGVIARTLLRQMLVPLGVGMLVARLATGPARAVQPWVALLSNIALYVVLVAIVIGYFPNLGGIITSGALAAAMVFILLAFGVGYVAGWGRDHLEDVGALGTAQRNTAAGLIVAAQDFADANVLVVMTVASTASLAILLILARGLGRDHLIGVSTPRLPVIGAPAPPRTRWRHDDGQDRG
ncbi:MAG TPA: bile acid:sodium symporter [Gemmatimonadaceae bacterium]|nr:bile acid:sodium symporter [Gemmatimonadaceae bacterium]